MNIYIIIIILILASIFIKFSLHVKFKEIKNFNNRGTEELRKISKKFPEDEKICKSILEKLDTKNVKVKINEEYSNCLYTVFNNTITIGKFKEQYMKIQTIAHECIHASQKKITLWSNFILSNIYSLYFLIILILTLVNKISNVNLAIYILTIVGTLHYIIRSNLENDAMLNAKYLTKEYIEENKICTDEEKRTLLKEYEEVNKIGIPFTNYNIIQGNIIKVIIYCIVILI